MNLDIIKRAGQLIVVNCDIFSGYTTAGFCKSEGREDLKDAILSVVTPVRHHHTVLVRVDNAPALQSLYNSPHDELKRNGISIELAHSFNKNSNCRVDKIIQELETEIRKISPEENKLSIGELCNAVNALNNRIRQHGHSAAELHFSRDYAKGDNLHLNDDIINRKKIEKKALETNPSNKLAEDKFSAGDLVYVKSKLHKHQARTPFIVTGKTENDETLIRKVLHPFPNSTGKMAMGGRPLIVGNKFLEKPSKFNKTVEYETEEETSHPEINMKPIPDTSPVWFPSTTNDDSDDSDDDLGLEDDLILLDVPHAHERHDESFQTDDRNHHRQ